MWAKGSTAGQASTGLMPFWSKNSCGIAVILQ
jgi:hypothetical protein